MFLLFLATSPPVAGQDPEAPTGQSIGRMIMVGFRGLQVRPDSPIVRQLHRGYVGGVVLYDRDVPSPSPRRNVASPEQVRRLVGCCNQFGMNCC